MDCSLKLRRFALPVFISLVFFSYPLIAMVQIDVCSNYRPVMEEIVQKYQMDHPKDVVRVTYGSSGLLANQILLGAKVDIFLSADQDHIKKILSKGLAEKANVFTYAIGQLVLVQAVYLSKGGLSLADAFKKGAYRTLAIANPKLAPYGLAAEEVLQYQKKDEGFGTKVIHAQNVLFAFTLASTGMADMALVSQSQYISSKNNMDLNVWYPPASWYKPIKQDAVKLNSSHSNEEAQRFWAFFQSEKRQTLNNLYGYGS